MAVKTVPKRHAARADMLRSEVALLRSIQQPNVVQLLDAFEDATRAFLVFEVC